jgi:mannosyltransferase
LFLPWAPVFLYQSVHTGTPWAHAPKPGDLLNIVSGWAGGELQHEPFLALLYGLVALCGWGGAAGGRWSVSLDLRGRSPGRWLLGLTFSSLLLAFIAGDIGRVAFLTRYTAAVAVPFILLLAVGLRRLPKGRPLLGTTALLVILGLASGAVVADTQRTESAQIAADIKALAAPGDLVVVCPDQLGPALDRYLAGTPVQTTVFPTGGTGTTVDWVGYADRNEAASPDVFALSAIRRAQGRGLWLVYADGYRTFDKACGQIREDFDETRSPQRPGAVGQVIDHAHMRELEHANLVWWPKPTG